MILQDLHPLLLHGVLPGGVGGAVLFNSVRTSRSFKFLGQQKAIKGVLVWLVAACLRGVGLGEVSYTVC